MMRDRILKTLTFYNSVNNGDIDLKFETENYGAIATAGKNRDLQRLKVKVTLKVHFYNSAALYLKNWTRENFQFFFVDTSWDTLSDKTIKTRANQ